MQNNAVESKTFRVVREPDRPPVVVETFRVVPAPGGLRDQLANWTRCRSTVDESAEVASTVE
jgi:hypothetical protein